MFVHEGSPSLGCDDVIPNSLERSHVSPMFSQPSFSPEHSVDVRVFKNIRNRKPEQKIGYPN